MLSLVLFNLSIELHDEKEIFVLLIFDDHALMPRQNLNSAKKHDSSDSNFQIIVALSPWQMPKQVLVQAFPIQAAYSYAARIWLQRK